MEVINSIFFAPVWVIITIQAVPVIAWFGWAFLCD